MVEEFEWSALLDALASVLLDTGDQGWLVGGCLRDALLGLPIADVDVALTGKALPVAELLASQRRLAVARLGHGTVRLTLRHETGSHLDLTPLQGETSLLTSLTAISPSTRWRCHLPLAGSGSRSPAARIPVCPT